MFARWSVVAGFVLCGSPAVAGQNCLPDEAVAFSCTLEGGARVLEICDRIERDIPSVTYNFGPAGGDPELSLTVDLASLRTVPWNGIGRAYTEAVVFYNGDFSYEVWASTERRPDGVTSGGVAVLRDGTPLAVLECDPGSVTSDFTALFERVEIARISP